MRQLRFVLLAVLSAVGGIGSHAQIQFKPSGALLENAVEVSISSDLSNAEIHYTSNGSVPNSGSPLYIGPLVVNATTVLRAACFENGVQKGESKTQSYILIKDALSQKGEGFPKSWGMNEGKPTPADYEMDPEVVQDPHYREELRLGLKSIPSVSLAMNLDDLFGTDRGIYANPKESGDKWERPVSFEMIDGEKSFQINCGIRIQGGWNRRPEESPKHSFRIVFRKKYGPGKLKTAIFGHETEFDTLILRAGCNNTWLHWNGVERQRGDFIRDQWMRDTVRDMGEPSASGTFIHLYLNGLYWGLYNLTERPDASFAASHFGGKGKDYDAFNADKVVEGDRKAWDALMSLVNAGVKSPVEYEEVADLLNMENFSDFMIANYYGANADWDRSSNWYAARRRDPAGKFYFFVWDAERTLEAVGDNTLDFDDDQSPPRIFHRLAESSAFREFFALRVKKHFSAGGSLSPEKSAARYRHWSDTISLAIIAESARWGDYRRDVHPYKEGPYELYTRDRHWLPEVNRLLKSYFPARSAIVLQQFKEKGLY